MTLNREDSVANPRWHHKVYPALGPEAVRRKEQQIEKLQRVCDTLCRKAYDLEQRNEDLERQLESLQLELIEATRAKDGFQEIVNDHLGFRRPIEPERDEYGYFT